MLFYSTELFAAYQHNNAAGRRAKKEWQRRAQAYVLHHAVIAPFLPAGAQKFAKISFHDAAIVKAVRKGKQLELTLDMTGAISELVGKIVTLKFSDVVIDNVQFKKLKPRSWWLYSEVHMAPHSRFAVHVMFHGFDVIIEASDVKVTITPAPKKPRGRSAK